MATTSFIETEKEIIQIEKVKTGIILELSFEEAMYLKDVTGQISSNRFNEPIYDSLKNILKEDYVHKDLLVDSYNELKSEINNILEKRVSNLQKRLGQS